MKRGEWSRLVETRGDWYRLDGRLVETREETGRDYGRLIETRGETGINQRGDC